MYLIVAVLFYVVLHILCVTGYLPYAVVCLNALTIYRFDIGYIYVIHLHCTLVCPSALTSVY